MSHDIDLLVSRVQLSVIKSMTDDMSESRHPAGRKWRATLDGIHLDLYVPHESRLGQKLQLRTETLVDHQEVVDGWVVLDRPAHVATKFAALLDRPDTNPGEKDRLEITALLATGIDSAEAVTVLQKASGRPPAELTQLIGQAFNYLGDLQLSREQRRHLNRSAVEWVTLLRDREPPDLGDPDPRLPGRDRRTRGPSLEI